MVKARLTECAAQFQPVDLRQCMQQDGSSGPSHEARGNGQLFTADSGMACLSARSGSKVVEMSRWALFLKNVRRCRCFKGCRAGKQTTRPDGRPCCLVSREQPADWPFSSNQASIPFSAAWPYRMRTAQFHASCTAVRTRRRSADRKGRPQREGYGWPKNQRPTSRPCSSL